jgi:hypothetical protein
MRQFMNRHRQDNTDDQSSIFGNHIQPLNVEAEVHNIPILHDIFFSFRTQ